MTAKLSRRVGKYAFLCVPSLFSLALTVFWLFGAAPEMQDATRSELAWKREVAVKKDRQAYLRKNQLEPNWETMTLSAYVIGQSDPNNVKRQYFPNGFDHYGPSQTIRLLDSLHGCIGYISGRELYLEADNPGLCTATSDELTLILNLTQNSSN